MSHLLCKCFVEHLRKAVSKRPSKPSAAAWV
jgi:hypothetical protein